MQKIPQKIVVLFAIVKISDIFSAYFFVNFCLKIWKNYTHWKKIAKFYGNIYYCKFFWEILSIFRWKIFHCTKKSRKILQKNIQCKNCEKNYEKISWKHFNLIPRQLTCLPNPQQNDKGSVFTITSTSSQHLGQLPGIFWKS